MHKPALLSGILAALLLASPAHAYIGPGLGTGTIAAIFGVLASIFFAFLSILWYPFKRFLRRRNKTLVSDAEHKSTKVSDDLDSGSHA